MKLKLSKNTVPIGVGVAVGTTQLYFAKTLFGQFGSVGIGLVVVVLSQYAKMKDNVKIGLLSYGFTALVGGLVQAVSTYLSLKARMQRQQKASLRTISVVPQSIILF